MCGKSTLFLICADLVFCSLLLSYTTKALCDDSPVAVIAKTIENFVVENGFPPDDQDFRKIILQFESTPSESDYNNLLAAWKSSQKPIISKESLLALYRGKVNGIKSFSITYDIDINYKLKSQNSFLDQQNVSFVFNGNKFYADMSFQKKFDEVDLARKVISYNGKYVSSVQYFFSASRVIEGSILPFEGFDDLLPLENPLFYAGLSPSNVAGVSQDATLSLVDFLQGEFVVVCGKPFDVEGISCIKITNGETSFYLAIQKDFSIVKIEGYTDVVDSSGYTQYLPYKTTFLNELLDLGNGVWVPKTIIQSVNRGSRLDRDVTIKVSKLELNPRIEDTFFTDIFPDNTLVSDMVRGLVYRWSDRPSIEGTLNGIIRLKYITAFRYLSMTIGLLCIVIAVVFKVRAEIIRRRGELC